MLVSHSRGRRPQIAVRAAIVTAGLLLAAAAPASAATLATLFSFNGSNGAIPNGELIFNPTRTVLFGSTRQGGTRDFGTIYALGTTGSFTTLKSLDAPDGISPTGPLARDAAGNLYGTAREGAGPGNGQGLGGVFKLAPNRTLTVLARFDGPNGNTPTGGLTIDASGNLYGTTLGGGSDATGGFAAGTVFKITPGGAYSRLATFTGPNGNSPITRPTLDAAGNVYGTTNNGGTFDRGTVFKIAPGGTLTTLKSFRGDDGAFPAGPVVLDPAGNVYGTTTLGGPAATNGAVFKIAPDGAYSVLTSFGGPGSVDPIGGVIRDAAGNLYGLSDAAFIGDVGDYVYRLTPDGTLSKLATFGSGISPHGSLVADAAGNLYGATAGGGANGLGTIFKVTDSGFVVPEPTSMLALTSAVIQLARRRRR